MYNDIPGAYRVAIHPVSRVMLAATAVTIAAPHLVRAQATAPVGSPASLMTPHRTPADTGRMTWGHQDYTRYTSAAACDRAVESMTAEVSRGRLTDTVEYVPAHDTLPTAAVMVARTCGARFTPEAVDPRDLWSLTRLALVLNDDARARTAVNRLLGAGTTRTDSATVLQIAIAAAMAAHPGHVDLARGWLARLDTLGDAVRLQRYNARLPFLTYWHAAYDADSLYAAADAALSLLAAIPAADRDETNALAPYVEKSWIANLAQDVATQQVIIDSGLKQIGSWRSEQGARQFTQMATLLGVQKNLYGRTFSPLSTPGMFHTGGQPRPAQGRQALIVAVNPTCGALCFAQYTVLRRLAERHPELDLTLVVLTNGFGPGSGLIGSDNEAKLAARYYLDFLKLPAALIVEESPMTRLPDGRIQRGPSEIGQMFLSWQWANAVLVDRAGKIRWVGWMNPLSAAADDGIMEAAITNTEAARTRGK